MRIINDSRVNNMPSLRLLAHITNFSTLVSMPRYPQTCFPSVEYSINEGDLWLEIPSLSFNVPIIGVVSADGKRGFS